MAATGRIRHGLLATVAGVLLLAAVASASAARPADLFEPPAHADARDVAVGPLDLRSVAFGQRDTVAQLTVRTQGSWSARQLTAAGGSLCVVVWRAGASASAEPSGRACVGSGAYRADGRTAAASFAPRALGLPLGAYRWRVEARWRDGASCAAACVDRVPDSGTHTGTIRVLAQPRCFGAAARDPSRRCVNPLLRRIAFPRPADALLMADAPCRQRRSAAGSELTPCEFGVLRGDQRATFALIGDSHARNWRAPLEVVAQARGWKGVSITRPGCPFSTGLFASPSLDPGGCARLHGEILRWLAARPYVRTIFVSGYSALGLAPAGFAAIWRLVAPSVRRIYVLRDIPRIVASTSGCVESVVRAHRPTGAACAVPRATALQPDPQFAAARAAASARVRPIDMTRYFCAADRCQPVIGGAYVHKDADHMNAVFATSLGPFLLRALR